MVSRHEINKRMVETFPCSKTKPQIFLLYVALGSQKGQYCIQIQNNKEIRREGKERKKKPEVGVQVGGGDSNN